MISIFRMAAWPRSAAAGLRRRWFFDRVRRADRGAPGRAEVGQFGFQAFDLEPQRSAARKIQRHYAGRPIGFSKLDRQKVEDALGAGRTDVAGLAGQHPLETQRRTPAAVLRL